VAPAVAFIVPPATVTLVEPAAAPPAPLLDALSPLAQATGTSNNAHAAIARYRALFVIWRCVSTLNEFSWNLVELRVSNTKCCRFEPR
jgi:hypothetical protein